MLQLRPYQIKTFNSLYGYWGENPNGNPLIVIPTGGGKSLIIAKACMDFLEGEPETRIVQVTHVKELIEQNYHELMSLWPFAPAGVYSASLGRREAYKQIVFAGIQSVFKQASKFGRVDVLFVDEAHLIPRDATTMYGRFIKELREINPNMLVMGLTATPYRLDSGRLDEGDDRLFDAVVHEVSIRELIDAGYLAPLVSKATSTVLDIKGVGRRGGDFIQSALAAAVDKHPITAAAVDEIVQYATSNEAPRRAWLIFCSGVEHAHHVADEVRARGYTAATITGDTPKDERSRIVNEFKAGRIRCLTNANVLTTGFNAPIVDLIAMLRPTESTSLYVQMVGRGTRCMGANIEESIRNGKSDCLVLDFAGNVRRHGPVDLVNPKAAGKGEGEAPVKECPKCHSLIFAGLSVCPDCGFEFERDVESKIKKTADAVPILSQTKPAWLNVSRRTMLRHEKSGGTPSIRVEYLCGMVIHKEWICPEHRGFARMKFEKWWHDHGGLNPPATIEETMSRASELLVTNAILIRANGKYWEVKGRKLGTERDISAPTHVAAPATTWRPYPYPWEKTADAANALADLDDDIPF